MERPLDNSPAANQTTERVPHSGNLPEPLREKPVQELNMPLSESSVRPADSHDFIPTEVLPTIEAKKSRKGLLIGASAGLAGVALVAGSIIGINASKSSESSNTPPVADPKETTEVIEDQAEAEISEFIESTTEMDVASFESLPQKDRLMFSEYIRIRTDLSSLLDEGEAVWTKPSIDNSAQEIYDNYNYAKNTATVQSKPNLETGESGFYTDGAVKLLSGVYDNMVDTNPTSGLQNYEERKIFIGGLSKPYVNLAPVSVEDFSANTEFNKNGEELVYRDILISEPNGYSNVGRFIYREFSDVHGQTQGVWLLDSRRLPDAYLP